MLRKICFLKVDSGNLLKQFSDRQSGNDRKDHDRSRLYVRQDLTDRHRPGCPVWKVKCISIIARGAISNRATEPLELFQIKTSCYANGKPILSCQVKSQNAWNHN